MTLQIKNLRSGETHDIPEEGHTFGRAGAGADIPLKDQAVSKKHAKIYCEGGKWFLTDLGSSNGTFVNRKKIDEAVELTPGVVFAMSRFKFEVMGGDEAGDQPLFDDPGADLAPPADLDPAPPPVPATADTVTPDDAGVDNAAKPMPKTSVPDPEPLPPPPGGDDVKSISVGYFMVAVPKAAAYFMVAVPALAIAPWKTIPRGVEEQKHNAMGTLELIAYALPALLGASLFGTVCSVIGTLVGKFDIGGAIGGAVGGIIGGIIGSIIGAAIIGFATHPVLNWVVDKLGGESDARSRTNYIIMFLTASIIVAVPNGLGTLIALLNIPLITVIAPILVLAGTLVMLFVFYTWFKYFRVADWFLKVILALGAIAVLGSVANIGNELYQGIKRIGNAVSDGGGDGDTPPPPKDDDDKDTEDKEPKDPPKEEPDDPPKEEPKDPPKEEPKDPPKEPADEPPPEEPEDNGKKAKKGKQPKKGKKQPKDEPAKEAPVEVAAAPELEMPENMPEIDYDDFVEMATDLDKAILENPVLLNKKGARKLYEAIAAARYFAEKKFVAAKEKNPALELVRERDRDLEVYLRTAKAVEQLTEIIDN